MSCSSSQLVCYRYPVTQYRSVHGCGCWQLHQYSPSSSSVLVLVLYIIKRLADRVLFDLVGFSLLEIEVTECLTNPNSVRLNAHTVLKCVARLVGP